MAKTRLSRHLHLIALREFEPLTLAFSHLTEQYLRVKVAKIPRSPIVWELGCRSGSLVEGESVWERGLEASQHQNLVHVLFQAASTHVKICQLPSAGLAWICCRL